MFDLVTGLNLFVLFGVLFGVVLVWMAAQRVPQGLEFTVERFGRYTRTLKPGLHGIIPLFDTIGAKMLSQKLGSELVHED